jgi:hypothetical protein
LQHFLLYWHQLQICGNYLKEHLIFFNLSLNLSFRCELLFNYIGQHMSIGIVVFILSKVPRNSKTVISKFSQRKKAFECLKSTAGNGNTVYRNRKKIVVHQWRQFKLPVGHVGPCKIGSSLAL